MYRFIVILLFIPSLIFGTDYYVDAVKGDDANNGTSMATAFQTIGEITDGTPVVGPGDNIYLRTGQTWREQVSIPRRQQEIRL